MKYILILLFSINLSASVYGQVIDPTSIEFDSIAHTGVLPDGRPEINSYVFEFYLYNPTMGLLPTVVSQPISKSLATFIGGIRYRFTLATVGISAPRGQVLVAKVRTIGPAGDSWSDFSNQFSFSNIDPTVIVPEPAIGFIIIK